MTTREFPTLQSERLMVRPFTLADLDDAKLEDYCWPDTLRSYPVQYERKPLLRE